MNDFLRQADRIPVTLVIAIAYVTLFVLVNLKAEDDLFLRLHEYGSLRPFDVAAGEAWRMIAAAFLHLNVIHIGFNMLGLLAIGPSLEMSLGSLRFALLYLVAGIGGHVAVCLIYHPLQGVLGGSGALFGMMGAVLALNMRSGRHLFAFLDFEGPRRIVGLIAINLVLGFVIPIVSNTGHIGGLLTGFAMTFCWLAPGREPTRNLRRYRMALTALFCTLCFVSLSPAARWDQLWFSNFAASPPLDSARQRAAAMHFLGIPRATDGDISRFQNEVFKGR